MLDRFRHIVEEMRGLVEGSAPFLLTVSGGMDSMCLADMWVRSFGVEGCAIAHCNFNLRGEDSDADEALVTQWAGSHGVKLHKTSFDTVQYASENGLSIEMAARELRYRWFGDLCREHGYSAVVTAHHADDNAETLVLNMVRGSGLRGLTGMKPVSPLPCQSDEHSFARHCEERSFARHCEKRSFPRHCEERSFPRHCEERSDVAILRPLLGFTRKQIEGYVFKWKVPYREDKTNASVEYRRNSIRHEIFPLFEKMNPSYVRTFNREMSYFSDAAEIVEEWCRSHADKVCHPCEERSSFCHCEERSDVAISLPLLLAIPQWRYLLYYILEPYGFNSSVLESLESLLTSGRTLSGKRFESATHVLLTGRDSLEIISRDIAPTDNVSLAAGHPSVIHGRSGNLFMPIRGEGVYNVGAVRFKVEVIPWSSSMPLKQPPGTMILDASRLKFPFVCRSWRQGDWMIPFGMRGRKKVSDMFVDMKYGQIEKANALMLVDCTGDRAGKQHIAGILGNRIDEHYKVTEDTLSVIRITLTD